MAELQVVSALVAKQGEFAGQAQLSHQELQRLLAELGRLDATTRLLAPAYDLGGIRPRTRRRGRRCFAPGGCQRLVLEVLRDADGPLSDQGVAEAVAARKSLQDRPEVLAALQKTAVAVLRRLTGKGAARAVELAGGGRAWKRA